MNRDELIAALRIIGPETGSLCCLGCGYERGCSVHGCAVIRAAVEEIEHPAPPPNPPLTLEELRGTDGEPVWVKQVGCGFKINSAWAFVDCCHEVCRTSDGGPAYFDFYGRTWKAYRRKPEEEKP